MNAFIKEARNLGFNIVWAPSDVTAFYPPTNSTARNNTLSLQHQPLPQPRNVSIPTFPISSATNGGCDTVAKQYTAWQRQIAALEIKATDFLIAVNQLSNCMAYVPPDDLSHKENCCAIKYTHVL